MNYWYYKNRGEFIAFDQPRMTITVLGKAMNKKRREFEAIGYCRELDVYLFGSSLKDYPIIRMCDEYSSLDGLEKDIDFGKSPACMIATYTRNKSIHLEVREGVMV